MRARLPTLITMFGAAAIVMLTLGPKPAPSLVWNASESVPIGLYRVPGQTLCRNALAIVVDGIEMGAARERDRRGRALPTWQGCRLLARGEVFIMNWHEPASLDGRYFGPIPVTAIVGRAHPLWTFEEE
jgi:type IV secretory pathway protease TraF